jgi:hypothetical protein
MAAMGIVRRTAGVWGPVSFAAASVVAARRQPGYSHVANHVSGLAAAGQPSAAVMVPGFLALGAASLLMPVPSPTARRMARLAGLTTIAAGLVPASQLHCPRPGTDPDATALDVGHGVASITTFVLWIAMPCTAATQPGPRWYRRTSAALGAAALAGFVAAGVTTRADSPRKGLAQRGLLAPVFAWHLATAAVGPQTTWPQPA